MPCLTSFSDIPYTSFLWRLPGKAGRAVPGASPRFHGEVWDPRPGGAVFVYIILEPRARFARA
eukprot:419106-Pyramimonas_sp.AAC.1